MIATHNPGKLAEMRELLAPYGVEAISAGELGLAEPDETGTTFAANARIKAEAAARATNLPAFSDDSGLCVDALGGDPGIHSARWAGPNKDFGTAMTRVENEIHGATDRSAHFVCVLALAAPSGESETFRGEVHGALTFPPRGKNGFGYDPIFVAAGMDQTFGEIEPARKHAMSHRAKAFEKFVAALDLKA